jgi:hypothetical protein
LLEFIELYRPYLGENMVDILLIMLEELKIVPKLLIIIEDNTNNNSTLYNALYIDLLKIYNDKND